MIKLKLKLKDNEITLTKQEAKELFLELNEMFGNKGYVAYPYPIRYPAYPLSPSVPHVTWCESNDLKIDTVTISN